jgi:hypothetical protein
MSCSYETVVHPLYLQRNRLNSPRSIVSFKLDRHNAMFITALTSFGFSMIAMRMNAILAATGTALFCSEIMIKLS